MITKCGRLRAVLALVFAFAVFFLSQPAASAQTVPVVPTSFAFADNSTSGTWKRIYGSQGQWIYGMTPSIPAYSTIVPTGASAKIWSSRTKTSSALQQPGSTSYRIASCWYSSNPFTFDVTITDGKTHRIAAYFLDWDLGYREELVEVFDVATGRLLESQTVSNFRNGLYLVWDIRGAVRIQISPIAGSAVVSGFFFDATPAPVDVKNYGAYGDGVHDDTAAIQKALNSGAILNLASRTYAVGALVVNYPVRTLGPGTLKGRSTLASTTALLNIAAASLFDSVVVDGNNRSLRLVRVVANSQDVKLRNSRFQNALQPAGLGITTEGIHIEGNTEVEISDCTVSNVTATANGIIGDAAGCGRGIEITQSATEPPPISVVIQGSTIQNVNCPEDGDGIALHGWRGSPVNVFVSNCKFLNCAKRAVKALSDGGTIRDITVESRQPMYSAISLYASDWDIQGVCATNSAFSKVIDIGTPSWPISQIRVASSWLGQAPLAMENAYAEGVWAGSSAGVSNLVIENNTVMNTLFGIRLAGGVSAATISSNLVVDATDTAIQIGPKYQADYSYAPNSGITVNSNHSVQCGTLIKNVNSLNVTLTNNTSE